MSLLFAIKIDVFLPMQNTSFVKYKKNNTVIDHSI